MIANLSYYEKRDLEIKYSVFVGDHIRKAWDIWEELTKKGRVGFLRRAYKYTDALLVDLERYYGDDSDIFFGLYNEAVIADAAYKLIPIRSQLEAMFNIKEEAK